MSLFRSKLWEFSAADQILNLGWFKAYLSSLWAFVPHPQTFSSDIFLVEDYSCSFSEFWLVALIVKSIPGQVQSLGAFQVRFLCQIQGQAQLLSCCLHIFCSTLRSFYFSDGWKHQLRGAGHIRSGRLVWIGWDQQMGFWSTQALTPALNSFSQCRVLLTKATVTFSPVQQVGLYVSCQRGFKQGKDKFKKRGVSNRKGFHSILYTRAFPNVFINLPNISIVVLKTLHSHYFFFTLA